MRASTWSARQSRFDGERLDRRLQKARFLRHAGNILSESVAVSRVSGACAAERRAEGKTQNAWPTRTYTVVPLVTRWLPSRPYAAPTVVVNPNP